MNDYSSRYSSVTWQQKALARPMAGRRRNTHVRKAQDDKLLLKTVGGMLLVVLTLGVGTSCWYGMRVRTAIDEIGRISLSNQELVQRQHELTNRKNILLQRDNLEKAAMQIGLFAPTARQLR